MNEREKADVVGKERIQVWHLQMKGEKQGFPAHNTVQAGFSQANGESLNQNYPLKESSDPSK